MKKLHIATLIFFVLVLASLLFNTYLVKVENTNLEKEIQKLTDQLNAEHALNIELMLRNSKCEMFKITKNYKPED